MQSFIVGTCLMSGCLMMMAAGLGACLGRDEADERATQGFAQGAQVLFCLALTLV